MIRAQSAIEALEALEDLDAVANLAQTEDLIIGVTEEGADVVVSAASLAVIDAFYATLRSSMPPSDYREPTPVTFFRLAQASAFSTGCEGGSMAEGLACAGTGMAVVGAVTQSPNTFARGVGLLMDSMAMTVVESQAVESFAGEDKPLEEPTESGIVENTVKNLKDRWKKTRASNYLSRGADPFQRHQVPESVN